VRCARAPLAERRHPVSLTYLTPRLTTREPGSVKPWQREKAAAFRGPSSGSVTLPRTPI
jgi:hypothetical protein